jgi:pyruvate dehydrogenase (quinone)
MDVVRKNVADVLWELLYAAGLRRCYGITGDALNPTMDALRRNGKIDFIHVRHEEYGGFAAVTDAYLTGDPVAICGTAGPGVSHLINAMIDARREKAPLVVVAADVETSIMDSTALEELNPYFFFQTASLYTSRLVNSCQVRAVVQTALRTALCERGPTVISLPGDVASEPVEGVIDPIVRANAPIVRPVDADIRRFADLIRAAERVTIFAGDGCRGAHDEVVQLAKLTNAPVGYSLRGKQFVEYDNPNAVGMTGLVGFGGAYLAVNEADLLLLLGTDFPFSEFLPYRGVTKVQVDLDEKHLGRRTPIDLGLVGDVKTTLEALLPLVEQKTNRQHLDRALERTGEWARSLADLASADRSTKQIRPEYLVATLDRLAADDAFFGVDTGTPVIWAARYIRASAKRNIFGSFTWASMASAAPNAMGAQFARPGRQTIALSGDGGFTMLGLGDMLTLVERKLPVVIIVFNNSSLDFVRIEQQEAGVPPFGVDFMSCNFAAVAQAMGAKGIRLEDPANVESALREALAHTGGPVVVDAVVDAYALSMPSHAPAHVVRGFTLSAWRQIVGGDAKLVVEEVEHNLPLATEAIAERVL